MCSNRAKSQMFFKLNANFIISKSLCIFYASVNYNLDKPWAGKFLRLKWNSEKLQHGLVFLGHGFFLTPPKTNEAKIL